LAYDSHDVPPVFEHILRMSPRQVNPAAGFDSFLFAAIVLRSQNGEDPI